MRVAIQKLPGVESVQVSLERASADVRLRPGNAITLDQLRRIIKDGGFTSKEATVTVVGTLVERGGQPALDVTGTTVVMLIAPHPKHPAVFTKIQDQLRAKPGGAVRLTGVVDSRTDSPDRIAVHAVSAL